MLGGFLLATSIACQYLIAGTHTQPVISSRPLGTPAGQSAPKSNRFENSPFLVDLVITQEFDRANNLLYRLSNYFLEHPGEFRMHALAHYDSAQGTCEFNLRTDVARRRFQVYVVWRAMKDPAFLTIIAPSDSSTAKDETNLRRAIKRWYIVRLVESCIDGLDGRLAEQIAQKDWRFGALTRWP